MTDTAAVFIDGGYLTKILQDFGARNVNFGALAVKIATGYRLLRTYYYDCPPYQSNPPTPDESSRLQKRQRFFGALRRLKNFDVREGYLLLKGIDKDTGNPIFQQKGVDIWLAVDLLRLSFEGRIEKACLITGDGDFVPAVQVAKDRGVMVHLYYGDTPNSKYAPRLWDECDDRTLITRRLISDCFLP